MLISIIFQLNMLGGVTPTPTDDQSGDGFRRSEAYKNLGKTEQEKQFEYLEQEHEMVFDFIKAFVISNN